MKTAIDLIERLWYKQLRLMGIQINGQAPLFCDNKAAIRNSAVPLSTLKKKHKNVITIHWSHEACVTGIIRIVKEDGLTNLANN
jgi:hypothetical protein